MTTEKLLEKRWKIVSDYPGNQRKVGDILESVDDKEDQQELEKQLAKYPLIFKELFWWEERSIEDMPEYVKHDKEVFKLKYMMSGQRMQYQIIGEVSHWVDINFPASVTPATAEEFQSYIASKK